MYEPKPLTKNQLKVYQYLKKYLDENTVAPTVREVAAHLDTSISNAKRYLDVLHDMGWIRKGIAKSRGISLMPDMGKPIAYLATPYSFGGNCSEEQMHHNYQIAVRAAWVLMSEGVNVYSPIVHHHNIQKIKQTVFSTVDWMAYDLPYLCCSKKLYVLCTDKYEESLGVMAEIELATHLQAEIVYMEPTPYILYGEEFNN